MAKDLSTKSLIVIGGGIVGLVTAVAAQARGHSVTIVAPDSPEDTASGVAAGMIAPALEALSEIDPVEGFKRLKAAQTLWLDLFSVWPSDLQMALEKAHAAPPPLLTWHATEGEDPRGALDNMGATYKTLDADSLRAGGLHFETQAAVEIEGDWLIEASSTLRSLQAHFKGLGGQWRNARAAQVFAKSVTLLGAERLLADHVVIAAGYGARAFSKEVPSLAVLSPIKGHLLDLPKTKGQGVVRSDQGYWARYADLAKFGATMQVGAEDMAIEPTIVANLKLRAKAMAAEITGLDSAVPRVGIRASSPDGWPLIGRDAESGVYVATAMRRNGFVFAPLAAQLVLDLIDEQLDGKAYEAIGLYDPSRF